MYHIIIALTFNTSSSTGWLEVVPEDGHPIEYFDTIAGIASVQAKRFLIRTPVVGYRLTAEEDGSTCWMPQEIKPGQILDTGIVYMDSKKSKTAAQRNIFKRFLKHGRTRKGQEYLQCYSSAGEEIMIPFIMSGVFSPVGDSTMANYDAVYELQNLVLAFGLPVSVQLIHEDSNEGFRCPGGVIRLYGVREEEVAVVNKVGQDGALFSDGSSCYKFEIPTETMLFCRGMLKKRPTIKPKLVEDSSYSYSKISSKSKPRDIQSNKGDYFMTDVDDIRERGMYKQQLSASLSDKNRPVCPPYVSHDNIVMNCRCASLDVLNTTDNEHACPCTDTQGDVIRSVSMELGSFQPNFEQHSTSPNVELPERVPKQLKKSRSTSILEKLSVRKVKKGRAKLKELRSDDVFTKRIPRCELSYEDFFSGLDDENDGDGDVSKINDSGNSKMDYSGRSSNSGTYQNSSSMKGNSVCSTSTPNIPSKATVKAASDTDKALQSLKGVQKRDLPPIPNESPSRECINSTGRRKNSSSESLYEHLPPAPEVPQLRSSSESALHNRRYEDTVDDESNLEDGYMVPKQVKHEPRYVKKSEVQPRNKPPGPGNDSLRSVRARRLRSELPREFVQRQPMKYEESYSLDNDLLDYTYNSTNLGESRPLGTFCGPASASMPYLYGTIKVVARRPETAENIDDFSQRLFENLHLEARSRQNGSYHYQSSSADMDPSLNATRRSQGLGVSQPSDQDYKNSFRSIPQRNPHYTFTDSQNIHKQNVYDQQSPHCRQLQMWDHSTNAIITSPQLYRYRQRGNVCANDYGMQYSRSGQHFHHNSCTASTSGISDPILKHGDDSAISICSRGDGGFPNESDYNYNEYIDQIFVPGDNWTPPEELEGLSVKEVSWSLRYIGMKDRVVLRFANEQIDGSMLCTLDKRLLKEGFPELNALEIKKILEFVRGWRPKKS